ncbi:MAG: hypothetical protein HPY66_2269 [Firmicutes bacterium]|nr:hypothetical protein [Bacillota bacterium]
MEAIKENELKLLIESQYYEKIRNDFSSIRDPVEQINYYFDSSYYTLEKYNVTLRIRKECTSYLLCMKVKENTYNDLVNKSAEYNVMINENDFMQILYKPKKILDFLSSEAYNIFNTFCEENDELILLGSIQNSRHYLQGIYGYIFELDKTTFPNGLVTYELEIEGIRPEHLKGLMEELYSIGIRWKINNKSKYKRFIEIIRYEKDKQ